MSLLDVIFTLYSLFWVGVSIEFAKYSLMVLLFEISRAKERCTRMNAEQHECWNRKRRRRLCECRDAEYKSRFVLINASYLNTNALCLYTYAHSESLWMDAFGRREALSSLLYILLLLPDAFAILHLRLCTLLCWARPAK